MTDLPAVIVVLHWVCIFAKIAFLVELAFDLWTSASFWRAIAVGKRFYWAWCITSRLFWDSVQRLALWVSIGRRSFGWAWIFITLWVCLTSHLGRTIALLLRGGWLVSWFLDVKCLAPLDLLTLGARLCVMRIIFKIAVLVNLSQFDCKGLGFNVLHARPGLSQALVVDCLRFFG